MLFNFLHNVFIAERTCTQELHKKDTIVVLYGHARGTTFYIWECVHVYIGDFL